MPRTILLAVLSLDGAWRTDAASPAVLRRLLEAAGRPAGSARTDIPELRRRVPGLRWMATDALLAEARACGGKEPFVILGTPALHAALWEAAPSRSGGFELLVLQRPEIVLGPRRRTLASPFVPADGRRVRFRLLSARAVEEGLLCRYRPLSDAKKRIPR